ncbi:MAG TPA: prepilin-type N-terminal cleavage/methylation domain-containing protein [Candidatus Methylacidiphilales bacterium]
MSNGKPSCTIASRSRLKNGFSLVELLCVIAIVSVLASATAPSIMGMLSGDQLTNNVYQLGGLVQQARVTAVTQHTYVWLGFSSTTKDGSPAVVVAMVSGNSGLSTDLNNSNYRLATKLVALKNVKLAALTDYKSLPGYDTTDNPTDAGAQSYTFTMSIPGNTAAKFGSVIAFGPDGQANVTQTGGSLPPGGSLQLVQCVGLGLDASPSNKLRAAAIQVHGLSGQVSILRQ